MTTVLDILKTLEAAAPLRLAADFDNPGFLVGRGGSEVSKVLVALDITSAVIDEAIKKGAELIVSHHPVIFGSLSSVTDCDATGKLVSKMIKNGISAICMHTNLDFARGGVNDILAELFELSDVSPLDPIEDGSVGCGRVGTLKEEKKLSDFLPEICKKLSSGGLRYYDALRPVKNVAFGGGSCGDYVKHAAKLGCDTFVTADIKHNQFLDARELSLNLIDAGHFETENIVCPRICEIIKADFKELSVEIAEANLAAASYFTVFER